MPWLNASEIKDSYGAGVTLAQNEDWQVRSGSVLVTTATPAQDGGLLLQDEDVIQFRAGETVHVRLAPGETAARIWREPRP